MADLIALGLLVAFALLLRERSLPESRRGLYTLGFGVALAAVLWPHTRSVPVSVLLLALLLAVPGRIRPRPRLEAPAWLDGRWPVWMAGLLSAGAVLVVWGSMAPIPVIHDEAAYLLQAKIFASGRWVAPGRPLPEFFEQLHVFVTPFLAGKYPPGHSLLLVPGIWLGWPALMPVLLNGLAGSLVFAHARRLAGGTVALVCWLIWVTNPGTFPYRASYLSENTTTVLWLLSLWALREWLERGGRRWVVWLALCLGWGAITRPMTMFALAIPIAVVFIRRVAMDGRWSELATAVAVGGACLAILPLWNFGTTGDWRTSPYRLYSRIYYPYQWTGFGVREEPPLRRMPPSLEPFDRELRRVHSQHTVAALPDIFLSRLWAIGRDQWGMGRKPLGVFAVVGALELDTAGAFAALSSLALVVSYLAFAHAIAWTPYYVEIQAFLSVVSALGLCGVCASLAALVPARQPGGERSRPVRAAWAVPAVLAAALLIPAFRGMALGKDARRLVSTYQRRFREGVARLPAARSILFVRYARGHNVHRSLVTNEPDLESARVWIVHDLGDHDTDLARLAPDRAVYLYDDASGAFLPLPARR